MSGIEKVVPDLEMNDNEKKIKLHLHVNYFLRGYPGHLGASVHVRPRPFL